jgi:mannosyltransferase
VLSDPRTETRPEGEPPTPAPVLTDPGIAAGGRRRAARRRPSRVALLAVGAVLLAGIVARFLVISPLWLDEAQSVAIARLPLGQLFQALREDGSPPLYYLLLHGWIALFGTGTFAVRALSGVFSLLTLALGYRVSRQLAGRRAALAGLVLLTSSPFAIRYASETRMYSLIVLLVVLGAMALRAVMRSPRVWPVVGLGAVTGALLLTHLWAFDLVAVVGLLALVGLRSHRAVSLRVLAGLVLGAVLFLPWLPSFLVQLAHTGTPWDRQRGFVAFPVALSALQGGSTIEAWTLGISLVLLIALGLLAVPSPHGPGARVQLALRLRPSRVLLLATGLGTLLVAASVSLLSSSGVAARYTSVAMPSLLALAAFGITALPTARSRNVTLGLVALLGLGTAYAAVPTPRTQAGQVASALDAAAAPGDLVVFCPDQLGPAVDRLAPRDLQLVVYPDLRPAGRIDWTDYTERNASRTPDEVAAAVLERSRGAAIWVVTASGYRVPSDQTCREFVGDLAAARGPQELVVARKPSVFQSMRLQRIPPAAR